MDVAVRIPGVDHPAHKWKETAPAIRRALEADQRFDVRIVEDHEWLASDVLFDYDLVMLHFRNSKPTRRIEKIRENLVKFVKQGKGVALVHFACGAFPEWAGFEQIAGKVYDRKKPAHDARGPFTVEIVAPDHPITRGMADFEADDELYTCLSGDVPVEVLATARSKGTGKDEPVAFTLEVGEGRVFHTSLGHDVKAIEIPAVGDLLRRGCLWASGNGP